MDKGILLKKINHSGYVYDKGELNSWVNSLPSRAAIKPKIVKSGDVFMHPIFRHPYILLKKKGDY